MLSTHPLDLFSGDYRGCQMELLEAHATAQVGTGSAAPQVPEGTNLLALLSGAFSGCYMGLLEAHTPA
jgi:hypothetical protein